MPTFRVVRSDNGNVSIATSAGDILRHIKRPLVISEERASKDGKVAVFLIRVQEGEGTNYHSLIWCYLQDDKPVIKEVLPASEIRRGPNPVFISALRSSVKEGRKCKMLVGVQSAREAPLTISYAELEGDLSSSSDEFRKQAVERLQE